MQDTYGREITYLRVSITDRCNLRCGYCMPSDGIKLLRHDDMLSYEEIADVVREAVHLGVNKVRITGGEPLVRRDIESLVETLADIRGIEDLAMTTNGILLSEHAQALSQAGLHRVNVSLDAIDPERYSQVTRGGDVSQVLDGIDSALEAGLHPIKLNCVVRQSSDEPDARAVAEYARERGLEVRYIHEMNLERGVFSVVEGGSGGDCPKCNRLRLSSDGYLRPCLFSDIGISVREFGPREALERAIGVKPRSGGPCTHNWIRGIGG